MSKAQESHPRELQRLGRVTGTPQEGTGAGGRAAPVAPSTCTWVQRGPEALIGP